MDGRVGGMNRAVVRAGLTADLRSGSPVRAAEAPIAPAESKGRTSDGTPSCRNERSHGGR